MLLQKSLSQSVLRCSRNLLSNTATTTAIKTTSQRSISAWTNVPMGPPDPIIGLNEAFARDESPDKVILGVGAYRDDNGKPYVLPCVREAEKIIHEAGWDHEYAGIAGDAKFVNLALGFAYGDDSAPLLEKRVAGVQSLSGTGGLRVFGEFLSKTCGHTHIYVPNPTWGNHIPIFNCAGLEVRKYRYYDAASSDLDFKGFVEDLKSMPEGSCVLLHACAHNPTGMDPTMEQWCEISSIVKSKKLLPFFDNAYQGFASGNAVTDAGPLRMFVEEGHNLAMVQSFSKNFGLYGQRTGTLSVIAPDEDEAKRVLSQLKITIRPMYSNPPRHGPRVVSTILDDPRLTQNFLQECKGMADRINDMRVHLRKNLEASGSDRNWEHITKQIGMFAFSGLDKAEVEKLRDDHHIYLTLDGRISMAGLTTGNVDYVADAIHNVTK